MSQTIVIPYFAPKPRTPKKYALCVGINYKNSPYALNGCLEDVANMSVALKQMGYQVTTLTEERATRVGIYNAISLLRGRAVPGDTLFFHYSGHGGYVLDKNREEDYGYDSTIIPYDFTKTGQIIDDDLKKILVNPLPTGVKLFGLIDSCHSGSCFDLRYQTIDQSKPIMDSAGDISGFKYELGTLMNALLFKEDKQYPKSAAEVYMMSGSHDFQTSADAFINGKYTGALTYCFLQTLLKFNKKQMKWKHLLYNTRGFLREKGFEQIPQLSSGQTPNLEQLVWF